MTGNLKKLDSLTASEPSKWIEKAEQRKKEERWKDVSFKVALKVLRTLREKNMTQKELAERMNVSPQYISKIVKGSENLSLETISALEDALSVDLFLAISRYNTFVRELGTIVWEGQQLEIVYMSYGIGNALESQTKKEIQTSRIIVYSNSEKVFGVYKNADVESPEEMVA
ncbi:helix-turn-helix transcriptional regulator [Fulvivirgaceae bacterium PWU5]|uniref:Helix-turn-helix transcriptional regulator n=1 Tax=Dawidia cretensis TaxID=2782350 RepID=A0AAP2DZH9_9BACT|nr:helix-turn-helix transcriptional regulator [Dawidia cretensis]MBT1708664.1 helix-turn-helix transcriptional regulator [Dawidia cretensis]